LQVVVTFFPVAYAFFNPSSQAICPNQTCNILNRSNVAGPSFTWTALGSSGNVSGYLPGSGNLIQQTLVNSSYSNETVTYRVTPTANGCIGTPSNVVVTVHPDPVVTFQACYDPVITTDAQPIKLKGGIPLGGIYSGPGIAGTTFYPATAGTGTHTLNYLFINMYGCSKNANQSIIVISPLAFTCGNSLMDVRDNQTYSTLVIGTQCWMGVNLNYGNTLTSANMQRDNCTPEKYCYNDVPGNCSTYGGLYQWDELMKYDNTVSGQGMCPPAWHVPTETEWNVLFKYYISNGFAGAALKYTGFSNFNAFLDGVKFKSINWNFLDFATLYWSSNSRGIYKAWAHGMNTYNPSVSFYPGARSNAFSVRCIKD
ncbi:MAG: FISUMP domain-containing protein, partial [Bacteroidota bacterium]